MVVGQGTQILNRIIAQLSEGDELRDKAINLQDELVCWAVEEYGPNGVHIARDISFRLANKIVALEEVVKERTKETV